MINLMIEPLLVIRLAKLGTPAWEMGILGSCFWVGVLAMSPYITQLVKFGGIKRIYIISGLIPLLMLPVFYFITNVWLWSVCNLFLGAGASFRWVITESLIAQAAPEGERGKFIGIFETLIATSFILGPSALSLIGTESNLPFLIAAIGFLVCLIPFIFMPSYAFHEKEKQPKRTFKKLFVSHPTLMIAAFIGGLFESGPSAFLPFLAIHHQYNGEAAAALVTVLGVGSLLMQLPIGLAADKLPFNKLLISCTLTVLLGSLLMMLLDSQNWILWPIALLWGAAGGCIYTLSMIRVGGLYKGLELMAATGALIFIYNLGTSISPTLTGTVYDFSPRWGITALLVGITGISLFVFLRFKEHCQSIQTT